jgi:hypothetical protein
VKTLGVVHSRIETPGPDVITVGVIRRRTGVELVGLSFKGMSVSLNENQAVTLINLMADAIDSLTPTTEGDTPS